MRMYKFCTLLIAIGFAVPAVAVDFPAPQAFSKYGQIQNVQSYSSNPFNHPDSPYNQRMPVPVYVQGTEIGAAECQPIVAALVAQQCSMMNNCAGKRVSDIRGAVMVQLSNIPGHNYSGSCGGFIDGAFNDYMNANVGAGVVPTTFPSGTTPSNQPQFKIENPLAPSAPSWLQDIIKRDAELSDLQAQNSDGTPLLAKADMPLTAADLSFTDRNENLRAGYEPWKDSSAYQTINIESDEDRFTRELAEAAHLAQLAQLNSTSTTGGNQATDNASDSNKIQIEGGSSTTAGSCDEKLKDLTIWESYWARLRQCKAEKKTVQECDFSDILPGETDENTSIVSSTGIATAGTAALIGGKILSAKNVIGVAAVPATVATNFTPVSNITAAGGITTGRVNGQPVRFVPATATDTAHWRYTAGARNAAGRSINGAVASNAPISGQNTVASPGSPAIAAKGKPWLARTGAVLSKAGGVLMIVGGTVMVFESVKGNKAHSWKDVLKGAMGGAMTGAGVGTIVPVVGNVAGLVGGTLLGTAAAGSQLFSETDCKIDPKLGVFTCCHTQFNKGERYVDIGGSMFCDFPTVRRCLQCEKPGINCTDEEGSEVATPWISGGAIRDDYWAAQCNVRYCDGWESPVIAASEIVPIGVIEEEKGKVCWQWECLAEDMVREGGHCVKIASNANNVYGDGTIDMLIQEAENTIRQIRKECLANANPAE